MGCPRRLFAAAALWLVTSSQRARPRRDLGASSAATSGQRYKPQRVATYAGPRLGDTVNRSASPLPRPWSACERCGVVTTINPPSEAILRVGNASGWCLVVVGDRKTARPYEAPRRGAGDRRLRNDHDALADYMSERPLYEKADAVVRVLDGVARTAGRLRRARSRRRVALYEHGLVALDDVAYAQLWLADLYAVGLALPKLRRHKARHRPPTQSHFSHGGTKLDTREKRTLPQLLTLAKDEVVARKDAEIAGLRGLAALKGDGSDMTGLPAVLRDFTPLAMVDDVAAIADGPELEAASALALATVAAALQRSSRVEGRARRLRDVVRAGNGTSRKCQPVFDFIANNDGGPRRVPRRRGSSAGAAPSAAAARLDELYRDAAREAALRGGARRRRGAALRAARSRAEPGATRTRCGDVGWRGLLFDSTFANSSINLHRAFVTPGTVAALLRRHGAPLEPDYVSVDIDSADVWVLRALLSTFRPRVVSVEYNSNFGDGERSSLAFPDAEWMPLDESAGAWRGSWFYGSSAAAVAVRFWFCS
ncbi:hypothetical protein JL722_10780 [Aureococcus anophagefferens]|nr:hypothetical protein JL722_10780 [Aureococcus anophagefferens]